jgi:hypothetical protein
VDLSLLTSMQGLTHLALLPCHGTGICDAQVRRGPWGAAAAAAAAAESGSRGRRCRCRC